MTAIRKGPTTIKDYYTLLKQDYKNKLERNNKDIEVETKTNINSRKKVEHSATFINNEFGINLNKYEEYTKNEHINGELYKDIKKFARNANDTISIRYGTLLLTYAESIEKIYKYNKENEIANKILQISYKDYCKFVKMYYYEVQKQLIINGYAYEFMGDTGCICINRCKNIGNRPIIDTKATKANKERLKKEGVELYDEKKAAFCKEHCIPYKGVEYRVFMRNEFLYEFPLLWSKLPNAFRHKFEPVDYWSSENRGKTKEDIKKEANGNLNYVCNLDITLRTKVRICNEIDETLYLNFIRNEHQTPITASKNNR